MTADPTPQPAGACLVDKARIAAVRHFNRFYTRRIGVLREGLLHTSYSTTEARLLYELAHRQTPTASQLARDLGLDAAYLSRTLARFAEKGLVDRQRSEHDARQLLLSLTDRGRSEFAVLDRRSDEEVAELLAELPEQDQKDLVAAMRQIEGVLDRSTGLKFADPFVLRSHLPGDMGWVTHRHGVLYAQEYGWDQRFEALVAEIAAGFLNEYDPAKDRCWIAELDGEPVGSVFCVHSSDPAVAKLRLLLVEPKARGMGLGARLVGECIRFASRAGYRKLVLWTSSILLEARHIYAKSGFSKVEEVPEQLFGKDLIMETWEQELA